MAGRGAGRRGGRPARARLGAGVRRPRGERGGRGVPGRRRGAAADRRRLAGHAAGQLPRRAGRRRRGRRLPAVVAGAGAAAGRCGGVPAGQGREGHRRPGPARCAARRRHRARRPRARPGVRLRSRGGGDEPAGGGLAVAVAPRAGDLRRPRRRRVPGTGAGRRPPAARRGRRGRARARRRRGGAAAAGPAGLMLVDTRRGLLVSGGLLVGAVAIGVLVVAPATHPAVQAVDDAVWRFAGEVRNGPTTAIAVALSWLGSAWVNWPLRIAAGLLLAWRRHWLRLGAVALAGGSSGVGIGPGQAGIGPPPPPGGLLVTSGAAVPSRPA